jgi:linoleoyl-CoA desaturase
LAQTTTIKFNTSHEQEFWQTLRKRVQEYFKTHKKDKTGDYRLYLKTILMFSVFFGGIGCVYSSASSSLLTLGGYVLIGLGQAGIGLCVMHDAMHGAFSKLKWVNRIMQHSMTLIGGNRTTWKIQHNLKHHAFTNIYELDEDIADKPFLRFSPYSNLRGWHKYQHIYAWILYCISVLAWLYRKDFVQLEVYRKQGMPQKMGYNHLFTLLKMIGAKLVFIWAILIVPILWGASIWAVITGFILAHMLSGLLISTVFQLAHVVECTEHDHLPSGDIMEHSWAVQQLRTTANFAPQDPIVTWLTGGLNHQVEHHLFPTYSHVHYPALAKLVRQTASDYGLPYNANPTFSGALKSHYRMLKMLGITDGGAYKNRQTLQPV